MSDIPPPLPGLLSKDPTRSLSAAASRRIYNAIDDAKGILQQALAAIECRYRSEPESNTSFWEYLATGQAAIEQYEAKLQAARKVLLVERDEFRAAGKSGRHLRRIMEEAREDVASCYELTTLQRCALWHELGLDRYPDPPAADASVPQTSGDTKVSSNGNSHRTLSS